MRWFGSCQRLRHVSMTLQSSLTIPREIWDLWLYPWLLPCVSNRTVLLISNLKKSYSFCSGELPQLDGFRPPRFICTSVENSPPSSRGASGHHESGNAVPPQKGNTTQIDLGQNGGIPHNTAEAWAALPNSVLGPNEFCTFLPIALYNQYLVLVTVVCHMISVVP